MFPCTASPFWNQECYKMREIKAITLLRAFNPKERFFLYFC